MTTLKIYLFFLILIICCKLLHLPGQLRKIYRKCKDWMKLYSVLQRSDVSLRQLGWLG